MDSSLPGSSVHGIFQARILERVAISSSRGSSWPRDQTWSLHLLHCQADSLSLASPENPCKSTIPQFFKSPFALKTCPWSRCPEWSHVSPYLSEGDGWNISSVVLSLKGCLETWEDISGAHCDHTFAFQEAFYMKNCSPPCAQNIPLWKTQKLLWSPLQRHLHMS